MLMEKIGDATNSLGAKILLGFIAVTFVLSGTAGYMFSTNNTYAVKVNGQEISPQVFQQRYNDAYQQLSQRLGDQFASLADTPDFNKNLRNDVLNQIIDQTLLQQYTETLKLGISKRQIETAIVMNPEFKEDGKFDNDRYLQILQLNGLSPDLYASLVRNNLRLSQLQNGIVGSSFIVPALSQSLAQDFFQDRQVRIADIPIAPVMKTIQINDDEIKTYYDNHQDVFTTPEQIKVQYIDLTHKAVVRNLNVTDVDIAQYYQDNKAQFLQQHLAHIQVATEEEANKLYQDLLNGADFATLAQQYSQDSLSAKNGGDLNWVTEGMMPKAFEDVAQKLAVHQISQPVKVDDAYHIIKVEEEQLTPLADVKAEILERLRNEMAINAFYNVEKKLSDQAFENPENLEEVGKNLGLPVYETKFFSRQDIPSALNYNNVITALFDSDLTQGGINSEAINVGDQHSIVVRVLVHKKANVRSLENAKAEIIRTLKQQKAQDKVFKQAQKIAEDLNNNIKSNPVKFGKVQTLSFAENTQPDLVQAIFALPKPQNGKPVYATIRSPSGEVKIVALQKVENEPLTNEEAQAFNQQLKQARQITLSENLIKALREQAEIKVNQEFMQSEE